MTRFVLGASGLAAMLAAGCGCGTAGDGMEGATLPSATTATTAPVTASTSGPTVPGPTTAGPTLPVPGPAGQAPPDPLPPETAKLFDRIYTTLEVSQLKRIREEVIQQRDSHPGDPLPCYAQALCEAHLCQPVPGGPINKDGVKALEQAVTLARQRSTTDRWKFLDRYFEFQIARFQMQGKEAVQKVVELLTECVRLAPGFVPARCDLAMMLLLTGNDKRAQEFAEENARIWPNRYEVWHRLAQIHLAQKQIIQALQATEKAHKLRPDMFQICMELLQLLAESWRQLQDPKTIDRIRALAEHMRTNVVPAAFKEAGHRKQTLRSLDRAMVQLEFQVSAAIIRSCEQHPTAESTYANLFGRVTEPEMRRELVMLAAHGLQDSSDPAKRVGILFGVLKNDAAVEPRVDAVRGLGGPPSRRNEFWGEQVRAKLKPLVQDELVPYARDGAVPREVRVQAQRTLGALVADASAAGLPLVDRAEIVATEFAQAQAAAKPDKMQLLDIYEELEVLQGALERIRGRSAARLPGFRDPIADFEPWLAKWKNWAGALAGGGGNPPKKDATPGGSRKSGEEKGK